MLVPPKYRLTKEVVTLLQGIEASREVIDSIEIPIEIEENIRRKSTLRSSLFSARIEGNELSLDEVEMNPSKNQKKAEVFNILKGLNWMRTREMKDLTEADLLKVHEIVMKGVHEEAGKYRREHSATFNEAGIAVYMHPPPGQVKAITRRLVKFVNSDKENFVPIRAALAHYVFEKIHPFLDGNGRVGRLVMQKVLMQGGYGMRGLLAIEEYIDTHRSEYYRALEEPEKDCTDYLLFMLEAIVHESIKAKKIVLTKKNATAIDYMLPRRAEIYNLIKDHKMVNFDFIKRRFLKVNDRTLRYDLSELQKNNLIRKRGATRGVYYEIVK